MLIDDEVRTLSALAFATSNCNYDWTAFAKRTYLRRRPYRDEYTGSLPNSEVNRRRARSVLDWGTVREHPWVPLAFFAAMRAGCLKTFFAIRNVIYLNAAEQTSLTAWFSKMTLNVEQEKRSSY